MMLRRIAQRSLSIATIAALCIGLAEFIVFVSDSMMRSPMDGWKNQIVDLAFQIRGHNPWHERVTPEEVVIVDIDDASIEKLGRPQNWPRAYDAEAITHVASGKPRAIGIDFLYTEYDSFPDVYEQLLDMYGFENSHEIVDALGTDQWLTQAVKDAGCVYLSFFDDETYRDSALDAYTLSKLRTIENKAGGDMWFPPVSLPVLPVDSFARYAKGIGSIAMPSMMDGTVRHYQLLQQLNSADGKQRLIGNFPLYMVADHFGVSMENIRVEDDGVHISDSLYIPLEPGGTFRINWLGNVADSIRYIPYHKVLSGRTPAEFFENKYVFFGTSASGMGDIKTVPTMLEKIPGVEVHAIAFLNMMNSAFVHEMSEWEALPWIFLLAFMQVALFIVVRPWIGFVLSLGLVFSQMMLFITWLMPTYNVVFSIATMMLVSIFAYIGSLLFIYFTRERRNRRLKVAFGSYVSPEVVEQIIKDQQVVQLGGERKLLTVLFSDIRSFTTYSEQMDPQQVVRMLNGYLSSMSECVFAEKGTIDKFIGDAIMAIFGAPVPQPDHADRACRVAIGMMKELVRFNQSEVTEGRSAIQIGIGINTDEMTVGNIGSEKRFDYTVVGDAVNLGSRLEGLTKFFGVPILVSDSTMQQCTSGRFLFRQMATVRVKGKEQHVIVHELVGEKEESASKVPWVQLWNESVALYNSRNFAGALDLLKQCDELVSNDLSTKAYLAECGKCLLNPDAFSPVVKLEAK
ncbi:MAG: CHASE2 domain-containing protein [Flavobacteriales bacterium]